MKCEMYEPTTQCISKTHYQMFSCLPLSLTSSA